MGIPHISIRKHICWDPKHGGQPAEPTSTVVLTSSKSYFVDIRIILADASDTQAQSIDEDSLTSIDWAFAGTSAELQTPTAHDGSTIVEWTHWIDSRHLENNGSELPKDIGRLFPPQANGDTLETGHMKHPDTGIDTDYEELWGSVQVRTIANSTNEGKTKVCIVLRTLDASSGSDGGVIVRIGQFIQGILLKDGQLSLERWQHDGEQWKRNIRIGNSKLLLPCLQTSDQSSHAEGDVLIHHGTKWQVLEKYEWT